MNERDPRIVAIIPARHGSVGLPRKNIADLGGVSLTARAVRSAKALDALSAVVVTSDSPDILAIAEAEGAVAIPRPIEIAGSSSKIEDTIKHTLMTLEDIGHGKFDTFCIFEPTSPLRRKETLLRCFEKYYSAEAEALITVCASTENFGRLRTDGKFVGLDPGIARRRQEREPLFKEAGVIYIRDVEAFQREQVVIPNEPTAYIVLPEEAIDINTQIDLDLARALLDICGDPLRDVAHV